MVTHLSLRKVTILISPSKLSLASDSPILLPRQAHSKTLGSRSSLQEE